MVREFLCNLSSVPCTESAFCLFLLHFYIYIDSSFNSYYELAITLELYIAIPWFKKHNTLPVVRHYLSYSLHFFLCWYSRQWYARYGLSDCNPCSKTSQANDPAFLYYFRLHFLVRTGLILKEQAKYIHIQRFQFETTKHFCYFAIARILSKICPMYFPLHILKFIIWT